MGGGLVADGKAVMALIGRKEGNCKRFVGRPYNNFLFYYTIRYRFISYIKRKCYVMSSSTKLHVDSRASRTTIYVP